MDTVSEIAAGFSSGIEPCATAVSKSSGDKTLGDVRPICFTLAVGTALSPRVDSSSVACPSVSGADGSSDPAAPAQPATTAGNPASESGIESAVLALARMKGPPVYGEVGRRTSSARSTARGGCKGQL